MERKEDEGSVIKIMERPATLPGCCSITGITEDEWFAQIPSREAFHGFYYISKTAFHELASLVGYAPKTSRHQITRELNELGPGLNVALDRIRDYTSSLLPTQELIQHMEELSASMARLASVSAKSAERVAESNSSQ